MPSRFASATIFFISAASKRSPCLRRTGVSMAITDTRDTTRAPLVWSITCCTSSAVNVARPGASGISVRLLSVCAQSPSSW